MAEDARKLQGWILENAGLEAKSLPIAIQIMWMMDSERWEAYQRKHTPNNLEEDGSSVVGSDQPLIASPGEDVILPCHITPSLSTVDMDVRWYRENLNNPVHLYEDHNDWTEDQDRDYRGRTALSILELQEGILSLNLRNLRPSDSGVYSCFATDGVWYGQGKTELIVRALGTQPSISMDSTQGEQTRLVCRSEGWSPEPEVIWRDRNGNDVTSLSNTTVQRDSQGLRSVSSYIKIKQQSNVFSCLVRSKIPKPDWESKLHISIDVTLDPDTANPWLTLSAEGKRVREGGTRQDLPDNPERFDYEECVLGRESFTSGRRYWQVHVGGNTEWRLGVRESAERKGGFSMTPQQGYWTVDWDEDEDEFTALADPQTLLPRSLKPQYLGVYLDYEEEQLSFYNVETRSHIYTFTDMEINPNEKLYPFFYTEDWSTDLVLESPDPEPVSAAD
ncbi:UNVERIFIED_CONTAM: hypothetical protein FKN15_021828 [Acipenser sinensis]